MDSYGDGNVYRGQVCKDPEIKTIEINKYNADVERLVEAASLCIPDEGQHVTFEDLIQNLDKLRSALEPFEEGMKNG